MGLEVVFGDAFYFIACINDRDAAHQRVFAVSSQEGLRIVTTDYVLLEVADALAGTRLRAAVLPFVESLRYSHMASIVPASQELLDDGMRLYANRYDKGWSLTDCISFVVMRSRGITEALTADRHFEQAGFMALLK